MSTLLGPRSGESVPEALVHWVHDDARFMLRPGGMNYDWAQSTDRCVLKDGGG